MTQPIPDKMWVCILYVLSFMICYIFPVSNSESVFMDKWSHCEGEDIAVDGDVYTVFSTGGGFNHEALVCDITFKARPDKGLCLTFKSFSIEDCGVTFKIFERSTPSGKYRDRFTCDDTKPSRICTKERYFTVKLQKAAMNNNKNYQFEIDVQEGDSFSGEDVVFTSIGVFVGIIVSVIIFIIAIAIIVIYCCCKKRMKGSGNIEYSAANAAPPVQPTAPPLHEHPDVHPGDHMINPPPYSAPPPYSPHDPYARNQPV